MDLFLKILGGATLTVLVVVVLFILWLVWKFRKLLKYIGKSFPTPATVSLTEESSPEWVKKDSVARDLKTLAELGYVQGPAYSVNEMPGVCLVALHHAGTGAHGCHYQHAVVGNWTDLCATLSDGLELTVSNAPQGGALETRPGTRKHFLSGKSIAQLHALLLEELSGHAIKRIRPEDFITEFQGAYARDMAWRSAKGGTSEEEFRRIAGESKHEFTETQMKDAFLETKKQEIERWSGEIIDSFSRITTLPVARWKEFEDRMCIFRPDFHPRAYLAYLNNQLDLDEEEIARYGEALDAGLSTAGLLKRIAEDTSRSFTKLGEVTEPAPTDILGLSAAPEEEEDDS